MTPDPAIQARIDALTRASSRRSSTTIDRRVDGVHSAIRRCCRVDGRLCESLVGNVVTDAMRTAYAHGVDFAITNSGGLRDALTCPASDITSDFCPSYTPPPFLITRGQVITVLPFGNTVLTPQINGAELKTMLENGVSSMPAAQRPLPAGLRALLHVQHRGRCRKSRHGRRATGGERHLHGGRGRLRRG